jgi:hypothetical protein
MTFFVTSVGLGKGGDLGGLAGADAHCQALAAAVGAGGHTWHAYLSTQARPGQPAVNARDRIGTGPWFNWSFAQLGAPQNAIISADLAELHGDTLVQAQRGSNLFKQSTRNEHGQVIHGIGDTPPIQHEILTGSKWDGRAYMDNADHTCNNWTSSSTGSAQVGHSDRIGNGSSWNSSNGTKVQPGSAAAQAFSTASQSSDAGQPIGGTSLHRNRDIMERRKRTVTGNRPQHIHAGHLK